MRPWVKGSAPSTTSDLEAVIRGVKGHFPNIDWQQLPVTHPGDDDGIWFFKLLGSRDEVQIESSDGLCPFLIETNRHDGRQVAETVEEVVETVVRWLKD